MTNRFRDRASKHPSKKTQTFSYRPLAFAIAVAISGTLPSVANAATFEVTDVADSGRGNCHDHGLQYLSQENRRGDPERLWQQNIHRA